MLKKLLFLTMVLLIILTACQAYDGSGEYVTVSCDKVDGASYAMKCTISHPEQYPFGYGENKVTWNFGDNSPTSALWKSTHEFRKPGSYRVTLIVTFASGTVVTHSFTLKVN